MGSGDGLRLSAIDLNLLIVLDALLAERSVTRAGERVGLSQPAASSALARLRGIFDDQLLEKSGRTLQLTERASLLQEPLRAALQELSAVLAAPSGFEPSAAAFTTRIFASDQMTLIILPALQERLKRDAPGIELAFLWADRASTFALLANETIDFAIGVYGDAPSWISREVLFTDEVVVMARRNHSLFAARLTTPRLLKYDRVLVSFEGDRSSYIETALRRAGFVAPGKIVVAHGLSAALATWDSDRVAFMPMRAAQRLKKMMDLDFRPPPFPIEAMKIELLWHDRVESQPALRWLRGQLADIAKTL